MGDHIDRWLLAAGLCFLTSAVGGTLWGFEDLLWGHNPGEFGKALAAIGALCAAVCCAVLGEGLGETYGYEGLAELGMGAATILAMAPAVLVAGAFGPSLAHGLLLFLFMGGFLLLGSLALFGFLFKLAKASGRRGALRGTLVALGIAMGGLIFLARASSRVEHLPGLFIAGLPSLMLTWVMWDLWLWADWAAGRPDATSRPGATSKPA